MNGLNDEVAQVMLGAMLTHRHDAAWFGHAAHFAQCLNRIGERWWPGRDPVLPPVIPFVEPLSPSTRSSPAPTFREIAPAVPPKGFPFAPPVSRPWLREPSVGAVQPARLPPQPLQQPVKLLQLPVLDDDPAAPLFVLDPHLEPQRSLE